MKICVACAEEIKTDARLCKHCGTRQDDLSFAGSPQDEANDLALKIEEIQGLIQSVESLWLKKDEADRARELVTDLTTSSPPLSLALQLACLSVCHENFGLLVVFVEKLASLPNPLKFAIISKVMYEEGRCGTPDEFVDHTEWLLENESRTFFWRLDETHDSIYALREKLVADPAIGIEPILDEYSNCGDISLLYAILENPICPREVSQKIADKDHFIFDEIDEENEEWLLEYANKNLQS